MLMALVALALVLSLVAAIAPNASAQDDAVPASEPSKWGRYIMPDMQDLQATVNNGIVDGMPKNCCITVKPGYYAISSPGVNPESASAVYDGYDGRVNRWCCREYCE